MRRNILPVSVCLQQPGSCAVCHLMVSVCYSEQHEVFGSFSSFLHCCQFYHGSNWEMLISEHMGRGLLVIEVKCVEMFFQQKKKE